MMFSIFSCSKKPANPLEEAILATDWKGIVSQCQKADSTFQNPVYRALAGHAAIMLNNNNLSFVLLQLVSADSVGKRNWAVWTGNFAERFPKSAVANYLYGDALMRNGDRAKGLESFNKAISLDSDFALAFNARGQLYMFSKDTKKAMVEFSEAVKRAPGVAEFYASRATTYYLGHTPEGAYTDFSKAVDLSPNFALAINGKACAAFYSFSDSTQANSSIDSVSKGLQKALTKFDLPVIRENMRSIILEIENSFYPDLVESPKFKYSDFLDYAKLRDLSIQNSSDIFRVLLKKPLPDMIRHDLLMEINKLLGIGNLSESLLHNSAIPDSLRKRITMASLPAGEKKSHEQVMLKNRLIFEKLYPGLIASYKDRIPGMHLDVKTFNNFIKDSYTGIKQFLQNAPMKEAKVAGYALNQVERAVSLGLETHNAYQQLNKINNDPTYLHQLDQMKTRDPAMYQRLRPQDQPGGAWADIRRKKVDDGKPYSLICLYTLGYENK